MISLLSSRGRTTGSSRRMFSSSSKSAYRNSSARCATGYLSHFPFYKSDNLIFVERPVDKTMFNQAAVEYVDQIAANLQRGYVIAIDYGFLDEEFERTV